MKLTKTEQRLLDKFKRPSANGRASVEGRREMDAARKLLEKGLISEFINRSEYVPPQRSSARDRDGNYKGVWFIGGTILAKE